jgi:hypothetical protein
MLYGQGWLNETIDLGQESNAPTKLLKACVKADVKNAKPFQSEDVYEDNPESLHNLEITMKKICKVKGKGKAVIEPEVWATAMTKQFKNSTVKLVCLHLAQTPVTIFKELKLLTGNDLDKIAVTAIWKGAHQLLGQIEESPKAQPIATPPKHIQEGNNPTASKAASAVKFTTKTKSAKKLGNQLFINKDKPKPKAYNIKISERKYEGYYKVKLPLTINPFGPKAVEETTAHFSNMTNIIWSIDRKAEILPWYDNNNVKPLTKDSNEIKTKEQLNKYTPNIYIVQGKNT